MRPNPGSRATAELLKVSLATFFVFALLVTAGVGTGVGGSLFSPNDLAGTWHYYSFSDNPTANDPGWTRATVTIDGRGNITGGSLVESDGTSATITGGSLSIDSAGVITGSETHSSGVPPNVTTITSTFSQLKMDARKTVATGVGTDSDNFRFLGIAIKDGGTFASSDLAGTWHYYSFSDKPAPAANDPGWTRATVTVDGNGNITGGSLVESDKTSATITGGTLSINSAGVITGSETHSSGVPPNVTTVTSMFSQLKMDAGKNVVAGVGTDTDGFVLLGVAIAQKPHVLLGWGLNFHGTLGDGTTTDRLTPVQVSNLTGVTAVAAGEHHSLALKSDGTVWAWGFNGFGNLGVGTTTDRLTPAQVQGPGGVGFLTGIVAIAAGTDYSLALKSDGTVWAWGRNNAGQLGDGTNIDRSAPVPGGAGFLAGVVAIATKKFHSLALKADGAVWAWGLNDFGQLGNGTAGGASATPAEVSGLADVIAIAAGADHSLALKADGTVRAWGGGLLGNGANTISPTPVQVSNLAGVIAIATGADHSLALKADGTVQAWGFNGLGQLGDGTTTDRLTPVPVSGITEVTGIAGGFHHSVALKSDGTVWAWGLNNHGQLGDGTTTDRLSPVMVPGLSGVSAVAAGVAHTLALVLVNTPAGSNVAVQPADTATGTSPVTVTFSSVTQIGVTSLTTSSTGPTPPAGFSLGTPPTYYQLTTTAVFTPPITVCINYITFNGPPRLLHFENGVPVDVTTSVDTVNQIICGQVTSLSPFTLVEAGTTPGRMRGEGHINADGKRHHFEFRVEKRADGRMSGSLQFRQRDLRHGRDRDDDHDDGRRGNRFVASAITFAAFSDDPSITPGRRPTPAVDTVVFGGSGRWNGAPGHTFVATAVDAGEPGRGRDTFAITVRAPGGDIVATVRGTLAGGNIQSLRLRR